MMRRRIFPSLSALLALPLLGGGCVGKPYLVAPPVLAPVTTPAERATESLIRR